MQCMSPKKLRDDGPEKGRGTQMLKGVLDLCILALLRDGPLYGYGVVDALTGRGLNLVAEGTIYPLLTRMEKGGFVSSYRAPSPEGPPRKYYKITEAGDSALASGIVQWRALNADVSAIFDGVSQDQAMRGAAHATDR